MFDAILEYEMFVLMMLSSLCYSLDVICDAISVCSNWSCAIQFKWICPAVWLTHKSWMNNVTWSAYSCFDFWPLRYIAAFRFWSDEPDGIDGPTLVVTTFYPRCCHTSHLGFRIILASESHSCPCIPGIHINRMPPTHTLVFYFR